MPIPPCPPRVPRSERGHSAKLRSSFAVAHRAASVLSAVLAAPLAWGVAEVQAVQERLAQVALPSTSSGSSASPASPPAVASPPATFPNDPRLDQALVMLTRGAFGPAATVARTVRAQHPDIDRATAILAIALEKEKRYEEARALLEAAAASTQPYPERRHVPHFLGWCCYHLGDLEAARTAF